MRVRVAPEPLMGQAVPEGILLRRGDRFSLAIRRPDGSIALRTGRLPSPALRGLAAKVPVVRGVWAVAEALRGAFLAAKGLGGGLRLGDLLATVAGGVAFLLLPERITSLSGARKKYPIVAAILEGLGRFVGLLVYLAVASQSPQVRRLFQYHGAEHKAVNAFEREGRTDPEAIRRASRLHARCGTVFAGLLSILSGLALPPEGRAEHLRVLEGALRTFILIGVAYELARWASRSKSPVARGLLSPGLLLQLLATREPDDDQIEVARTALVGILEG